MFMEIIKKKDKVSPCRYIKCLLFALQVLCGGCRLGFVEAPLIFFVFPLLFGLCSRSPDNRSAVCGWVKYLAILGR